MASRRRPIPAGLPRRRPRPRGDAPLGILIFGVTGLGCSALFPLLALVVAALSVRTVRGYVAVLAERRASPA